LITDLDSRLKAVEKNGLSLLTPLDLDSDLGKIRKTGKIAGTFFEAFRELIPSFSLSGIFKGWRLLVEWRS
jgi:hypothetical protein